MFGVFVLLFEFVNKGGFFVILMIFDLLLGICFGYLDCGLSSFNECLIVY